MEEGTRLMATSWPRQEGLEAAAGREVDWTRVRAEPTGGWLSKKEQR